LKVFAASIEKITFPMAKANLKTSQNDGSVDAFLAAVENEQRRSDAYALLEIFDRVTGLPPKMWGSSIIGYGRYEYKYESGREGEYLMTGFSPRKANSTVYIMPGYQNLAEPLSRLGKHKIAKSCLYINKLGDIDLAVLEEIILFGLCHMRDHYPTYDS
jgi:hypothetical protein